MHRPSPCATLRAGRLTVSGLILTSGAPRACGSFWHAFPPSLPVRRPGRSAIVTGLPGRRVTDDVVDISLRAVAGILCTKCTTGGFAFNAATVPALGDGVNVNDILTQEVFPYVAFAHSGRDSSHVSTCAPNCAQ